MFIALSVQCIPESKPLPAITQGVGTNVNRFISYTVIMFNSFRGGSFFCFCPYVFFFLSCILFKWKAAKLTRRRVVSPCNLGAFPDLWVGFFFFLFFLRSSPKSNSFSDTSKAPCRVTGEWMCVQSIYYGGCALHHYCRGFFFLHWQKERRKAYISIFQKLFSRTQEPWPSHMFKCLF